MRRLAEIGATGRLAAELLVAPWPPLAAGLIIIGAIGAATPLVQIAAISHLIDALVAQARASPPASDGATLEVLAPYATWLGLLVGAFVVNRIIYFDPFHEYLAAQLNERVKERIDGLLFRKALRLRLDLFESPRYYDALERARRALGESTASRNLTRLQTVVSVVPKCLAILVALAGVSWLLPLPLLAGGIALISWRVRWAGAIARVRRDQATLQRRRTYWRSLLVQREAANEVRLFGLGDHVLRAWQDLTVRLLREVAAARLGRIRGEVAIGVAAAGLKALVALALILGAAAGRVSVGELIALLFAVEQYLDETFRIANRLGQLGQFWTELPAIAEFLDLDGEEPIDGMRVAPPFRRAICFEGVSFRYPGAQCPTLVDLNLEIRAGERLALVGENGAGKTTLVKLLVGLYRPTAGRILVDGVDLARVAPDAWRERVGGVLQDYVRYALTVRENVGFGRLDRLDDQAAIQGAARRASADAIVQQLPDGYETPLSKEFARGRDLSQGQWQKIAIARAYLRDADVLVIHEPTSALDALAERGVYEQFVQLARGKAVLLISHRLGSARLADRIVFLQQGRIAQTGTHDALIAAGGPYAELYALQAAWYREPPPVVMADPTP